jgi:DNA-binding winged helix-turn-helix (wHTH) protein
MDEREGSRALGEGGAEPRLLRFDGFQVDAVARVLSRGGEPVALTPKAFSVLLVLLERPGEVVTKADLLQRVWAGSSASEANLTQCISALRKALGESASERRFVVTVPGQGYCFGSPVTVVGPAGVSPAREVQRPLRSSRWRRRLLEAFAALLVAAAVVAWVLLARAPADLEARPAIAVPELRNLSGREEGGLASALSERLTAELAADGRLRVVPDAARADLVLGGSFLALGNRKPRRIRLDLRVVQVGGGETLAAVAEVGSEARLSELVGRAAARLIEELDLSGPPPADPPRAR